MTDNSLPKYLVWAEFKFSVVGHLLSSPPDRGELKGALELLSKKSWKHPISKELVRFSFSTIERWYYQALGEHQRPMDALKRSPRSDREVSRVFNEQMAKFLLGQYKDHRSWSIQLHFDNLLAAIKLDSSLGIPPSYSSAKRFFHSRGLTKKKVSRNHLRPGYNAAVLRLENLEVRSYENPFVLGLWHLDFHKGSRQILTKTGGWVTPIVLGILDDHSRLICHMQWYLTETTEDLVHGFIQALMKRNLPRALMTDNGSAMISEEFTHGLRTLNIIHETTLPYSPYQNGKQECFWGQVEGRFIAMLESKPNLTLKELNDMSQAWVEMEYNKKEHSEIKTTPLNRFINGKDVGRPSPTLEELKKAFRRESIRKIRRSDGSIPIEGIRFEVPSRYLHLQSIRVQYTKWNLSLVHMVDVNTGTEICPLYPVDKNKNANGERRAISSAVRPAEEIEEKNKREELPPLMKKLMADYAATGLPPAYIPSHGDKE